MLLALAFVPQADVISAFNELRRECPAELHGVYDEFKEFFIIGRPARGRRPATRPRYSISLLWNQYETAINKSHRTNNVSEGWHNRFRLVGKHHPDIYAAIGEIQKEQGYTEVCITELAMGEKG